MALQLASIREILDTAFDTVIDVRSPSEYAEDHLPGAISLPVLSDAERAEVGRIYTRDSPFKARKIGAALVARNAARHLEGPLADFDGGWRPLVYCWRGGQRSGSFASILREIGWRVDTIAGGYRSYRRLVVETLYEEPFAHRIILLDGNTGTAKTELLELLKTRGLQTLDLEGLANHRGSVFGAMGGQPSQKTFESRLAGALAAVDPGTPMLIEAESSKIGRLLVPPALFKAMRTAPRIEIAAQRPARAAYLLRAYRDLITDAGALRARLDALIPIHGRAQVETWQALVTEKAYPVLAEDLIERHYDPRYAKSRMRRESAPLAKIEADALDPTGLADLADRIAGTVKRMR